MSSAISGINSSIYSGLFEDISSYIPSRTALDTSVSTVNIDDNSTVDLSGYYSNILSGDVLQTVSENVVQSSNDLTTAMVQALENGYTVQDACNIQMAKAAYEANCRVAKSTFELSIWFFT